MQRKLERFINDTNVPGVHFIQGCSKKESESFISSFKLKQQLNCESCGAFKGHLESCLAIFRTNIEYWVFLVLSIGELSLDCLDEPQSEKDHQLCHLPPTNKQNKTLIIKRSYEIQIKNKHWNDKLRCKTQQVRCRLLQKQGKWKQKIAQTHV